MVTVRKATKKDTNEVLPLLEEFYKQTKHYTLQLIPWNKYESKQVFKSLLDFPATEVFVAEKDGEIIGTAGVVKSPIWLSPRNFAATELFWYVKPSCRKTRAGKLLFNALEEWALCNNCVSNTMVALEHLDINRVANMYKAKDYEAAERTFIKRLQ